MDAFLAAGCLSPLLGLLARPVHSAAVLCIVAAIAKGTAAHCDALAAAGCLPRLVAIMGHISKTQAELAQQAVLRVAGGSSPQRDAVVAAGCLP